MPHPAALLVGVAFGLAAASLAAQSHKLPPPSRTVYKCVAAGKVTYSDEPCLAAEKLEIEPTRGLDKATGTARVGADVQRERSREQMADALKPITGMDAKSLDTTGRRMKLEPAARSACAALDRRISQGETQERATPESQRASVQQQLLGDRQRYRRLGC
jgi:hypothetical protein